MNQQRRQSKRQKPRHETAMNEIGRSMREHVTRRETMAEERAAEWRKREQEWAGILEQTEMGSYEMASMEKPMDDRRCQTNSGRRNTDERTRE